MGFDAPDLQARAGIIPGPVARVRLVPDKVGTFTLLCEPSAAQGVRRMSGTITVVA